MPVHAVRLTTKGDIVGAQLTPHNEAFGIEEAQAYFGKKAVPQIVAHYYYKDLILYVIGYAKGKAGTENRTSLIKPYEKTVLYGDALVVASKSTVVTSEGPVTQLTPFNVADFKVFQDDALTLTGKALAAPAPAEALESDDEELADFEEEEDEDINEDSDEESGAESEEGEAEVEAEPEELPAPKRKKKVIQLQVLSGYQKQSQLIVQEGHDELHPDSAVDVPARKACAERFTFLTNYGLTDTDITQFEHEIFLATLTEATTKHIFAHWKNPLFQEIHTYRQFRLFSNLHPESPVGNRRLLKRVQERELSMADLARLEDMELYPENWKRLQDQQLVREQKWLEGNKMVATDMFKCNRCGKKETTYYEMQTRSADEPMTIFITCVNCGKKWKQ